MTPVSDGPHYPWLQLHHQHKRTLNSKHIHEKIIKKYKSGDGYKNIFKSLNIHRSSVKIIKKWKECGKRVKMPRAGLLHKLSECARRRLVREANKTPLTTLKELNASAQLRWERLCIQQLLPGFFTIQSIKRQSGKEKAPVEES